MIDPADIAEVAATVLTTDGHAGRGYELTGPEAVTFDDVAGHLSDLVGRPIGFIPVPDDAAFAQLVGAAHRSGSRPIWSPSSACCGKAARPRHVMSSGC